jgi:hypothetical protein
MSDPSEDADTATGSDSIVIQRQTTFGQTGELEVNRLQLFDPENEQAGRRSGTRYNDVEREVSIPLGNTPEGEYTLVAYSTMGEIGRDTLTLRRSFEVVGGSYNGGRSASVGFEIRATGDLPLSVTRIEILESNDIDGWEPTKTVFTGNDILVNGDITTGTGQTVPGSTDRYGAEGGSILEPVESDTSPPDSCDGQTLQRRYELRISGDESVVLDVTVAVGGAFIQTAAAGNKHACETGEPTAESTSSG